MPTASRAELVQLQPAGVVALALPRAVRALLADGARQADHGSVLGLCHVVRFLSHPPGDGHAEQGLGTGGREDSTAKSPWVSTNGQRAGSRSRRRSTTRVNGSRTSLKTSMLTRKPMKISTTPTSSPMKNDQVI